MPQAKQGSLIIVESDVYNRVDNVREDLEILLVPAREIAVGLGNQIVANMVMLGALANRSEMVNLELLKEALETNMRESMREINLKALQMGYDSV
jgi:2-oxoglutarate ferredoxin oxidoreductase subunit gamma